MKPVHAGVQAPVLFLPGKQVGKRQGIGEHPAGVVPVAFVLWAVVSKEYGKLQHVYCPVDSKAALMFSIIAMGRSLFMALL